MALDYLETDLQSLKRLYGILQEFSLDENTHFLLKCLLDSARAELLATQSKILATAQLVFFSETQKQPLLNVPDDEEFPKLAALGKAKFDNRSQVADSIKQIETQLSGLRFSSSRVDSYVKSRSCKSVNPMQDFPFEWYEKERRQRFQASMSGSRMSQTAASTSKITPSLTSVNNAAEEATIRSRDDPTLPLVLSQGKYSPGDEFVRVRSRPPLPRIPARSVGFEKPSQSKRASQKMMSIIKPTLLDQESQTWDDEASENTQSGTSSEDEELVSSADQESQVSSSRSVSSWETQEESVSGEEKNTEESNSSSPPESEDDSEVSSSPPRKKSDLVKQRKKAAMGRFTRLKNKIGQVFHHHHHYHHHHHHDKEEEGTKNISAWKHLQKTFHQKDKEKSVERQRKSESRGLTIHKQQGGGHFHGLVEAMMKHRRQSKKTNPNLQRHGRKTHWWQTFKRQGGVKRIKKMKRTKFKSR